MRIANRASTRRRFLGLAVFGMILSLAAGTRPVRADLLFFKDGFPVEGKVKREVTLEFDKVGRDAYYLPKGFFYLDDGPRNIFFSPSQVLYVSEKDPPSDKGIFRKNPLPGQLNPKKFPGLLTVAKAPDWDDTWSRRFRFLSGHGVVENVPQHIGRMTPYWTRVDSLGRYFWSCAYLTRELGPETVQSLLASHPDFQDKMDKPPTVRASM
ncbi:MAG: hypothetical protein ACRELF_09105, partial [Gemmataceae bacterium]